MTARVGIRQKLCVGNSPLQLRTHKRFRMPQNHDPGSVSGARTVLPCPRAINQGRQLARVQRSEDRDQRSEPLCDKAGHESYHAEARV